MVKRYLLLLLVGLVQLSCSDNNSVLKLDEQFVNQLQQERENKDWEMQNETYSPFIVDSTAKFQPLKYYDPTGEFIFNSKLYKKTFQDTIAIFGTRGEERKAIVEGYVLLNYQGKEYKLNIYKSFGKNGPRIL